MPTFNITKDFDLADLAGVPSDGSTNTKYTAGTIQGVASLDDNGYPLFYYPVGWFNGDSGFMWGSQSVGVPVPDYGTVSSSADGATAPAPAPTFMGMPPAVGHIVLILAIGTAGYLAYKHFKKGKK